MTVIVYIILGFYLLFTGKWVLLILATILTAFIVGKLMPKNEQLKFDFDSSQIISANTLQANITNNLEIPKGWKLVRRKSYEWYQNGFTDGIFFPGYGKIFNRTFEVWYCNIGSNEKNQQSDFTDKAILTNYKPPLVETNLNFESLIKTKGYEQLFTAVDNSNRIRWYYGLKTSSPTYIFTAKSED